MEIPKEVQEELKRREGVARQAKAARYMLQGMKYILAYLPDYPIYFEPRITDNPIILTLKIYWGETDFNVDHMPSVLRDKLENIEKELLRIGHTVGNPDVSQPIGDNRTSEPILGLDKRLRNVQLSQSG